jgi:hypothetical protein
VSISRKVSPLAAKREIDSRCRQFAVPAPQCLRSANLSPALLKAHALRDRRKAYLDAYIAAAGIADDNDGPPFRTTGRSTGTPHRLTQQDAYG